MSNNLLLVKSEMFGKVQCDIYKHGNDIFMTRDQIGTALEYSDPIVAISKLHSRHSDRLDKFSVVTKVTSTDGKSYDTTMYTAKGVYEVCRWSKQEKANDFVDWAWDVLETIRKQGYYETEQYKNQKEIMDRLGRMESNLIFQCYEPPKAKLISLEARYFCRLGIDKNTRKFYDAIMDYTGINIPKGDTLPKGIFVYEYIFNNIPMEYIEEFVVGIERGNIVKSKEGHWTNLNGYSVESQWKKTLESFGHTCAYCGKSHYEETLLAEHIVPQSQMGLFDAVKTDYSFNVVPSCSKCNYSKYTHPMELWFKHQPFYDEQRYQKILRHIKKYEV